MSDILNVMHETINDLYECGAVDHITLSQFEEICLTLSNDDDGVQESKESS